MTRNQIWRPLTAMLLLVAAFVALRGSGPAVAFQEATPTAYSCDDVNPMDATPASMQGGGMDMGTPMAGMEMEMELDQLYIDMMIPHHMSIIALSEAALTRLEDERLIEIANSIIEKQGEEIGELRGYREEFYGSPDPMPMDAMHMDAMSQAMPGMGSMEEMAFQMDPEAQVAAICAAEDADVAFIDLVIPHHQMAITASEAQVEQGVHEEVVEFAERVIEDQQAEIDELETIREELAGSATPTS